jgi:hypothetical protein
MTSPVEALLLEAKQKTGLIDFGDEWFLGPLEAFVSDLDSPHLSEFGRTFLRRQLLKDLCRRLVILDCLDNNPDIENTPVPPILYITGHERTGTTLLHNLLSQHAGARFLSRWQLMSPVPPPVAGTLDGDPRRQEVANSIEAVRGTDLEAMHWVEADDPEECVWGFMDSVGILGMAPAMVLPNWDRWLGSNDLKPAFVNYRRLIQLLTWKNPLPRDGFLVLKSPQLASHLDSFGEVFPEATFLYLHRDPYRVLTSFCTLLDVVNVPFLGDVEYQQRRNMEEGYCIERMARIYGLMDAYRQANPGRVLNVQYVDLLTNPGKEVQRIFHESGYPADPELGVKIAAFLDGQRAGGRAPPRPTMSTHGYTREQVESHPSLATYIERYAVKLEPKRKAGTG